MVDALALAREEWLNEASGAEVAAFYEGISAGLSPDCHAAAEPDANDEPLDALVKKGKGKGKDKRCKGSGGPTGGGGGAKEMAMAVAKAVAKPATARARRRGLATSA